VGHSNASELSMSEPTKDQELIRTLDISLLARKNSFGLSQLDKESLF